MRPSPSSKKRHQYDKFIQSRVLITSHSMNPLSQHISTKLDLIKQQISRQFHQKYPTDKKRTNSMKKSTSSSKSKFSQSKDLLGISKKLNFTQAQTQVNESAKMLNKNITHGQEENQTYRQKFFDLQDKFIAQRKKMIDDYEKSSNLKQKVLEFLQQPSFQTAESLYEFFNADRHKKIIQKFISMHEDICYAQKTLKQILQIVETDDIQSLLQQLRNRQAGFKSLSQCSVKILQLETAYNRQQKQWEQKYNLLKTESERKQKQLVLQMQQKLKATQECIYSARKEEETNCKKLLIKLRNDIQKKLGNSIISQQSEIDKNTNILFATFDKIQPENYKQKLPQKFAKHKRLSTSIYSIQEQSIEKIVYNILLTFEQMQQSIMQIQKQAEQNIQKLMISKQDMDRLQKLIENVTYETEQQKNKLIQHFELIIQQKTEQFQQYKQKLQADLKQKDKCLNQITIQYEKTKKQLISLPLTFEPQITNLQQKNSKKQKLISQIIGIIGDTTGQTFNFQTNNQEEQAQTFRVRDKQQVVIKKIQIVLKKHLMILKQNLQAAENMILWQQKQIQIKQGLLKQFDFNLKKLVEEGELIEERSRKMQFERDQYKYLLTNLRENVRQLKIEHEEELKKLSNQKDQEYLNSNKDILLENNRINQLLINHQKTISNLTQQLSAQSASHIFHRKKSQQFESNIVELRKKLIAVQSQSARYKQHLTQIQQSFKQVESMSQLNSQKMIGLQETNKLANSEVAQLRVKVQSLLAQVQVKDQDYSKLQYKFDDIQKKCDRLGKNKQDLQLQNSNIRLKNLETMEQIRQYQDKIKKIQHQNTNLTKENKKLMQEVNLLTKKLLAYVGQKNLINKTRTQIREQINNTISTQFLNLKKCFINQKSTIQDYLSQSKIQFMNECQQIKNELTQYLEYKQTKQKMKEKERQKQNQEIKNIQLVFDQDALKQHLQLKKNEKKMQKVQKQLSFMKQQANNFREYCNYVKEQFLQQKNFVNNLLKQAQILVQKQNMKLGSNEDILIKSKLELNSLRNEKQQIKQEIEKFCKQNATMVGQFQNLIQNKINELISKILLQQNQSKPNISLPSQKSQNDETQLNKYLQSHSSPNGKNSLHSSQKGNQQQDEQFMSPQFVRSKKQKSNVLQESLDHKKSGKNSAKKQQDYLKSEQSQRDKINQQINSERVGNIKNYSFKQTNSGVYQNDQDQINKIRWSGVNNQKQQAQRVKRILICLKDNEAEEPKISYFNVIKSQYRAIKQKLLKNLALDISAVSFRHNTISSPSSFSFSKDFLVQKRFNTQPNEQQPMQLGPRSTNRSQYNQDHGLSPLIKQNQQLREQLQRFDQQIKIYEYRQQQYKITITELEKQKIELQNQASKQMKQKLMIKFITDLCKESWREVESSCKILLKLLGFSTADINQKIEALKAFISKHEKKNSGFMGGLFQKSTKN